MRLPSGDLRRWKPLAGSGAHKRCAQVGIRAQTHLLGSAQALARLCNMVNTARVRRRSLS